MLAGVDLVLEPGTITEVTGGNGSGKSTLLRILAGLTRPTRGGVRSRPAAVAYAPERLPARPRMTARSYVGHMAALRGLDGRSYEELLERFGLSPSADVPMGALSKGNRQKVVLAQALAPPAGLVLVDEPASGLDIATWAVVREVLDQRRSAGAAVLLATHHPLDGMGADLALELSGGALRAPAPAAPQPMARIELARGAATRVVEVPGSESDAVLAGALAEGWSVVSVRRL